jgi:hypothetical protein
MFLNSRFFTTSCLTFFGLRRVLVFTQLHGQKKYFVRYQHFGMTFKRI